LRQQGRLDPFLNDIQGFYDLLQRHSFLRYSSDLREYNVKRMVVIDGIVEVLEQATEVSLPVIYEAIPVENLREVSAASVQRLVRETIRNLKRSVLSLESSSPITNSYQKAILRWEAASHALRVNTQFAVHA